MTGQTRERLREVPGFTRYWTAFTVSSFGTYVTTLAIQVLVVVTLHGGAAEVGLVSAARWLPYLLFGLFAGVLADRLRRRPLLIGTDLVRGVLLLAVPLLATTDALSIGVLMVFMVVFGTQSVLNDAAEVSFLPRLAPRRLLPEANARLDQSDAVAQTSGPALAGALVSLLTAPWAVLVDAASYLASALLLLRIPVVEPVPKRLPLRTVPGEAMEGLRFVYRHRTLRPHALTTHAWFLCFAVVGVVVPPFALRTLGLSPVAYGLALAVGGAAGLVGALTSVRLGRRFGVGRVVVASNLLTGVSTAVIVLSPSGWAAWLVFGLGEVVLGIGMGISNANEMGYRQAVTPDELQGRVNGIMRSLNRAMIVIGAPLGGLLADTIGFRPVLWLMAAGFVLVAATLALSPYRSATLSDE